MSKIRPVSVGQIMAEVLCVVDGLDEVDSIKCGVMGDCFNAMSFEARSMICAGIAKYLEECGVEVEE